MVKVFLAFEMRKVGCFVALIFGIYVKFLDLLFLNKFTIISLTLLSPLQTILLLSPLNTFETNSDYQSVFNKKIGNITILLKSWMKYL